MSKYFLISTLILFSFLKAQEVEPLTLETLQNCAVQTVAQGKVGKVGCMIQKNFNPAPKEFETKSFGNWQVLVGKDTNGQQYFFKEDNLLTGFQVLSRRCLVSSRLFGTGVRTHTVGFVNGEKTEIFDVRYASKGEAVKDVVKAATLAGAVYLLYKKLS